MRLGIKADQDEGNPKHATNILKGILIGVLFKGLVLLSGCSRSLRGRIY